MPISQPVTRDSRIIFSCGERAFAVKDVVDWAVVRGEIEPLWKDFVRVRECERLASEKNLELDDSALDSASIAFRYEHDLITAEETERWLEDRGATLDEFGRYFARRYWGRVYSGPIEPPKSSYQTAAAEEKDLFLIDLILSGSLERMADRLSWRVAAQTALEPETDLTEAVAEKRALFLTRLKIERANLAEWLERLGRDSEWFDDLLKSEVAYERRANSLIGVKDLENELVSMRLLLTRFEIETVEVDSRDAAAEVIACVRNDGMEMAEVAEESRYPFRRSEVLLEDFPEEQQQRYLSVKAGTLLEPLPREDAFEVCRVKTRTEPTLQDAAIRERLEARLTERHFGELVSSHIDWKMLQQQVEE